MNMNTKRFDAYKKATSSDSLGKGASTSPTSSAQSFGKGNFSNPNNLNGFASTENLRDGDNALIKEVSNESVYTRVAKFLIIIGSDEAAKILPLLSEEQTQKIIPEIATIKSISDEEKVAILKEFQSLYQSVKGAGGKDFAQEVLIKAYGAQKANELLERAKRFVGKKPFDYLSNVKVEKVASLLKDESNQTKSLVLANLESKKAAAVINSLDAPTKKDVILRLSKMGNVSEEALSALDKALYDKLQHKRDDGIVIDGKERLADILKAMTPAGGSDILSAISREDEGLGEELRKRLFTLEDVVGADAKYIQARLHDMQSTDIARLIVNKTPAFREKILSCISSGRKSEVLEEEEYGTFLKADCVRITNDFLARLRADYEKGTFIVAGRNDDEYV